MLKKLYHKIFCKKEFLYKYDRDDKNRVTTVRLVCIACGYETEGWRL